LKRSNRFFIGRKTAPVMAS